METKDLSKRLYDIVVEEVDAVYPKFMKRVNNIDLDYFDKIACYTEELPTELNLELRDKVLVDMKSHAVQLLEESNLKEGIGALTKGTDEASAKEVLNGAMKSIRCYVYAKSILNGSSDITEEELQKMYKEAQKRDMWEYIKRNNKNDIIRFYHALMNRTYEQSKDILYGCIESFMGRVS